MIEPHVTFALNQASEEVFEAFVRGEYAPAMSLTPGFVRVMLARDREAPSSCHLATEFGSVERAAEWRASDAHRSLSPMLKALSSQSHVVAHKVVTEHR